MTEVRDLIPSAVSPEKSSAKDALQQEAFGSEKQRTGTVGDRVELVNTRLDKPPENLKIGPTDPEADITVTLMVRSKASEKEMDETIARIASHKQNSLTEQEYDARFGADPQAMKRVLKFVSDNGITAAEVDPDSGRLLLKGKIKDFNQAFNIELTDYKLPQGVCRGRSTSLTVPKYIGNDVVGVFGLESRPDISQVQSNAVCLESPPGKSASAAPTGLMPGDVAKAYNFPTDSQGAGQSVAIVEFGGGLDLNDNAEYYKQHGLKLPDINIVGVDGGQNKLGSLRSEVEVALDSQTIGAIAPDAKQMLIFAPRSDQGIVDSITRATFCKPGEIQNSAISISWGAPEDQWNRQVRDNLDLAFKKAALKGITVFAATGDMGAKNGTDKFTAYYPASDPYVTGTGGTELHLNADGTIAREVGWNNGGGGISKLTPVPGFQKELQMPPNGNNDNVVGRGVPDISGDAAPATGYIIRVRGHEGVAGGTSAVAPFYAALTMRINGALGKSIGYLNPYLYQHENSSIFKDVTSGNNGYAATKGWDAVTGLGTVDGLALEKALKTDLS